MNTLHLKYALEVERAGSITQAADNLFMGQPNLSKVIKELEESLGISIFKRTAKGIVPTEKGEVFLQYARNILSQMDEMESLCKSANPNRQEFNISIPRCSYISKAVADFIASLDLGRSLVANIKETNSMRAINYVADGLYNIAIIRYQTMFENYFLDFCKYKNICCDTVWEFERVVFMSENHPLAKKCDLRSEDFDNYIEITHGDTSVPYLNAEELQKPALSLCEKKVIYLYERGNQFGLLTTVPGTYMWGSPIPQEILKSYHLVQRKCSAADNLYKDVLIHPKGYTFTEIDRKFMDKLYESKNEVAFRDYN